LGTLLGQVLVEQEGQWLLDLVERIRVESRAARHAGNVAAPEAARDPRGQTLVLRAFGLYFQLANLAEQHHRIRRRREDEHDGLQTRESLAEAFAELPEATREPNVSIRLVLTAHPTEATRRTVM